MTEENTSERAKASASLQQLNVEGSLNASLAQSESFSLTRSELVEALDFEIQKIEEETKRPGWSAWALQVAIATLLWLAMNEFSPKSNLKTIGIVFLFGSLLGEFLQTVSLYCKQISNSRKKQLRFHFLKDEPSIAPILLIFTIVRACSLLLVYYLLDATLSIPSLGWFYGTQIFFCALLFPLRSKKILTKKEQSPSKIGHWVNLIYILWSGFLAWRLFATLPFTEQNFIISDYRIGILLAVILYLIWLLISGEKEQPVVNTLKDIRRELAFGRISTEEAAKEADATLSGLTAVDAIEHKLTEISKDFQKVITAYETLVADCNSGLALLKMLGLGKDKNSNSWKKDAQKIAFLVDSCETKKRVCQQSSYRIYFNAKSALRTIKDINNAHGSEKPKFTSKWNEVESKLDRMRELEKSSLSLVEDLKSKYLTISQVVNLEMN